MGMSRAGVDREERTVESWDLRPGVAWALAFVGANVILVVGHAVAGWVA